MAKLVHLLQFCQLIALASAAVPSPINVTLSSENFQHILSWSSGNPSVVPMFYTVRYRNLHGDQSWSIAKNCSYTPNLTCDLTNELTDPNGYYLVGVNDSVPEELTPIKNTVLGPPVVHITSCKSCINVKIQPPVSYLKSFKSLISVYHILQYKIKLEGPGGFRVELDKSAFQENFETVIDNLLPKTNYCISVEVSATVNINNRRRPSALKCIVTDSISSIADSSTLPVMLAIFFSILMLVLLVVLQQAGCIYLRRTPLPKALKNVPKSEHSFSENKLELLTEQVCPVDIIFKEKKKKVVDNSEEEDDSDEEVICEDYTFRIGGNTEVLSDPESSDNINLHTSTHLLLVETSGQEKQTLDIEATKPERHQSSNEDESGSSKLMTPLMDVGCSSAPLDNSGHFNVNLASVLLGDLEKPLKEDLAGQVQSRGDQESSTSSQDSSAPLIAFDIDFLMDAIGVGIPESLDASEECYANEALLADESDDSDDNQVSEYMRR